MLTLRNRQEVDIRVMRGMEFLDANYPGWERKIDPAALKMQDPSSCILGHVGREFIGDLVTSCYGDEIEAGSGYDAIRYTHDMFGHEDEYGFDMPMLPDDGYLASEVWSYLGESWIHFIKQRFEMGVLSDDEV